MFNYRKRKVSARGQVRTRRTERKLNKVHKDKLKEEEKNNLEKLASRFLCHVCGISSNKPARRTHETIVVGDWGFIGYNTVDDGPNWDEPGDLTKCSICHEWTCAKDLSKGICKTCTRNP